MELSKELRERFRPLIIASDNHANFHTLKAIEEFAKASANTKYTMIITSEDERYRGTGEYEESLAYFSDQPWEGDLDGIFVGNNADDLYVADCEGLFYSLYHNETNQVVGQGMMNYDVINDEIDWFERNFDERTVNHPSKANVYLRTIEYAEATGDYNRYRDSHALNRVCAYRIDQGITRHLGYPAPQEDDARKALVPAIKSFGVERVAYVLAKGLLDHNTFLNAKPSPLDFRFSDENRQWATTVPMVDGDCAGNNHVFSGNPKLESPRHLVDQVVTQFRQDYYISHNPIIALQVNEGDYPRLVQLPRDDMDLLDELQNAVNGHITVHGVPHHSNVAIVCNKANDALSKDDLLNLGLSRHGELLWNMGKLYAGSFLVIGVGRDGFDSLVPELCDYYEWCFHRPQKFDLSKFDIDGSIAVSEMSDDEVAEIRLNAENTLAVNEPEITVPATPTPRRRHEEANR